MDRLFLDANVLFSAAYREDSGLRRLWTLPAVELVTSAYAAEEARRNLDDAASRSRLAGLLADLERLPEARLPAGIPELASLPPKDRPILAAAVRANATHLITGDIRHFGPLFGGTVAGVLVQRPADYLRGR